MHSRSIAIPSTALRQRAGVALFTAGWLVLMADMAQWLATRPGI